MARDFHRRIAGMFEDLAQVMMMALVILAVFAVIPPPKAHAADDDQFLNASRGIGSRLISAQLATITMAAGATTQGTITVPAGSWIRAIKAEVPTAFTGSPTNINLRAGSTAAGNDIMADTDVKAAGHFSGTMVAGWDATGSAATAAYTINFQIATVGGTSPVGTVYVFVDYVAPVR